MTSRWTWGGVALTIAGGAAALLSHGSAGLVGQAATPVSAAVRAATDPATTAGDSAIATGYRRLVADLDGHFWDSNRAANVVNMPRLRPTQGDGGPRNGLLLDQWKVPTFWQMAQYAKLMTGEWRIDHDDAAKRRIAQNWAYLQKVNTPAELSGDGSRDRTVNISDDAAWKANYLAQVHEVTGDPAALAYLMEMIPATLTRFADPKQPRIDYGTSAGGRPFFSNPYGMLYAADGDAAGTASYGRISSLYEVMLAYAALYVFEQTGNDAYRRYAVNTWRWVFQNLRNEKENDGDSATGIYLCDLQLDPATFVNGRPVAKNRYFGKPIRGLSAEYSGGTLAMAVLSARLYKATGDAAYLSEARSIAAAFVRPDAFLRLRDGTPLLVNERDPWTEGYWYPDFVAQVLVLPGVDGDGRFRAALRNTAAAIVRQRTGDGYYGADWSGAELNIADKTRTWIEEAARGNGGRGGGQALPQQIMTSANSGLVVQAAYALGR